MTPGMGNYYDREMLFGMLSLVIPQATWGVTPLAKPELAHVPTAPRRTA